MIELEPGARTEEGEEGEKRKLRSDDSVFCARDLCVITQKQNLEEQNREKVRNSALGWKSFPKRTAHHKMLLNKIVHLIRKSN